MKSKESMILQTLWFQTSSLQNWARINFCCFKSPNLWNFVVAVLENYLPVQMDISSCTIHNYLFQHSVFCVDSRYRYRYPHVQIIILLLGLHYIHIILVLLCCHNKVPQIGWFKQQKFIFSHLWSLEVQDQGAGRTDFFWGLVSWPLNRYLLSLSLEYPSSVHAHVHVCIQIFSSYNDISQIRLGPT